MRFLTTNRLTVGRVDLKHLHTVYYLVCSSTTKDLWRMIQEMFSTIQQTFCLSVPGVTGESQRQLRVCCTASRPKNGSKRQGGHRLCQARQTGTSQQTRQRIVARSLNPGEKTRATVSVSCKCRVLLLPSVRNGASANWGHHHDFTSGSISGVSSKSRYSSTSSLVSRSTIQSKSESAFRGEKYPVGAQLTETHMARQHGYTREMD